ncbi:MAG: glucosyl-3-phosphoglycerate synthase [Microthrixaceae bacterium]
MTEPSTSTPTAPPLDGPLRSVSHRAYDVERLASTRTSTVTVALPARNEAATVGDIVAALRRDLVLGGLVDELIVMDDHSSDDTAVIAAAAGARVVPSTSLLAEVGWGHGKGEVLWKSLCASRGEVVVWCDADITDFSSHFVTGLLGPLLSDPEVQFAKGHYARPGEDGTGGGRVTELVARPLLSMFFPHLAQVAQPLSGEFGGRRALLERLGFVRGYGVDVGLLIDVAAMVGVGAIAQVDLELRTHRNRPLAQLGPQAAAVAAAILRRVDPELVTDTMTLERPDFAPLEVELGELPPMVQVDEYRRRAAT